MDEKYLWPLIGVVLGWLLTQFATSMKDREAKKRRVGRLLSKLILTHGDLRTIISVTEEYKNHADDWVAYERYRKGICERHFLEPLQKVEGLQKAIDEASSDFPLRAIQLQATLDALQKSKKTSLAESSKNKELYIKLVSLHEVGLKLCEDTLIKQIRALALIHGIGTYLRIRHMQYKSGKLQSQNQSFLTEISNETFGEMKKREADRKTGGLSKDNGDGQA